MFVYRTKGTCSRAIQLDIEDNIVKEIAFLGGCQGNLKGVSLLAKGRDIDELISTLQGVDCGGRGTSCPDQLANALIAYKKEHSDN